MILIKDYESKEILAEVKLLLPSLEVRISDTSYIDDIFILKIKISDEEITLRTKQSLKHTIAASVNNNDFSYYNTINETRIKFSEFLSALIYNEFQNMRESSVLIT